MKAMPESGIRARIVARLARVRFVREAMEEQMDLSTLRAGGYDLKKAIAQSIACRAAVMSGDRLTDQEAVGLLNRLLQCENMYSCPHGRPTFIRISQTDLDRQFGRC